MKTALVIGGTGMTGKQVTHLLVGDKRYSKIILLIRTPLDFIHQKLEQIVFDFDNPDESLVVADDIFCCLGTTMKKAGSKAAFHKVDYEYVLRTAEIAFKKGAKRIALVSAAGANKNSAFFYQRTKGEIEEAVSKIGYEGCFIARPSILVGHRTEERIGEALSLSLMNIFSFLIPQKYKPVASSKVAKCLINEINSGKTGVHITESAIIRKIMA